MKKNYEIIITADQSPTLRLQTKTQEESMHSHGGAFAETIYIYAKPFEELPLGAKLSVLSVGLGLGYNEILTVCESLRLTSKDFYLESYESDPFLIQQFIAWIHDEESALKPVYETILKLFASKYNFASKDIKSALKGHLDNNNLRLKKAIGFTTVFERKFNIILYDAFCSRTSPELWSEGFLKYVLESSAARTCTFTTYACKSVLNQALRDFQFQLQKQKGFSGKRESTFAKRP